LDSAVDVRLGNYYIDINSYDAHCCHMGAAAIKHLVEHQSAQMSKIANDDLIWSGTGCFIAVSIWQLWASKG